MISYKKFIIVFDITTIKHTLIILMNVVDNGV